MAPSARSPSLGHAHTRCPTPTSDGTLCSTVCRSPTPRNATFAGMSIKCDQPEADEPTANGTGPIGGRSGRSSHPSFAALTTGGIGSGAGRQQQPSTLGLFLRGRSVPDLQRGEVALASILEASGHLKGEASAQVLEICVDVASLGR